MIIRVSLVCILAWSWTADISLAATIYVNNRLGNDRATGQNEAPQPRHGPVRTLRVALILAQRSDRIVLANTGEPYREMISLSLPQHSGSRGRPFVIEGNGAVLDGTVVAAPGAWKHETGPVFSMKPRRLAYQQLFGAEGPLTRRDIASEAQLNTLEPLEWVLLKGKIFFRPEEGLLPSDHDLHHAGLQTGITLYDVRHVRIENLVVQGFHQDGINAHELVRNCQLVDVECRANGRAGLSVGGVSNVEAIRSNFYDNGRVEVRTEGLAELELVQCDVSDSPAPPYRARGRSLIVDGKAVVAP